MLARTVLLLLAAAFPAAGAVLSSAASTEFKNWLDGPIRYILTSPEVKAFKKLETDPARAAFIESFWARRDPNPDTLVNEFRQMFWERVRHANELFVDSAKPGWRSDRGKIYILYGPPTRIEDDINADTRSEASSGRGLIRWTYEGSEAGRKDVNPVAVVVPFVRDVTGEYRLSSDPRLASVFYTWEDMEDRSVFETLMQTDLIQPGRSPLAVMLDMGKMQTIPMQEEVLLAQVETVEAFGEAGLPVAVHQYRDPGGGGSVLTLTLSTPEHREDSRAAILARLLPLGVSQESPILLGEGSFRFEGEGAERQAQGRTVLEPGSYELTILMVVPAISTSSVHQSTLVVPDPSSEALGMSDLTLAMRLERVRYDSMASYTEPFMVGAFHVVPRVSDRLRRGDELALFFEVYGGRRPYNVTYRLEIRRDAGWMPVSRPVVQEGGQGAQGWAVPTSDAWPVGKYRVVIDIEDSDGATETAEIGFDLAPARS